MCFWLRVASVDSTFIRYCQFDCFCFDNEENINFNLGYDSDSKSENDSCSGSSEEKEIKDEKKSGNKIQNKNNEEDINKICIR